jgi:hypothetical protein
MLARTFSIVHPLDDLPESKNDYPDPPQPPRGAFQLSLIVLWCYVPVLATVLGFQLLLHY